MSARLGEIEERLIVGFERVGAERPKRVAQPCLGDLERLQALGRHGAIFLQFALQTSLSGAAGQPADNRAEHEAKRQREGDGGEFDGHEYRTTL